MKWLAVQVPGQHLGAVDVAREYGRDAGRNIRRANDVVGVGERVPVNLGALDRVVDQRQRRISAHVAPTRALYHAPEALSDRALVGKPASARRKPSRAYR